MRASLGRAFLVVAGVVLLLWVFHGLFSGGISKDQSIKQVWPAENASGKVIMNIPYGYIDGNEMWFEAHLDEKKAGRMTTKELFYAEWPAMRPRTRANNSAFVTAGSNVVRFLAESGVNNNKTNKFLPLSFVSDTNGDLTVKLLFDDRLLRVFDWMESINYSDDGLSRLVSVAEGAPVDFEDFFGANAYPAKDFFVYRKDGRVEALIICDKFKDGSRVEVCRHSFTIGHPDLLISAHYPRTMLGEWALIQKKIDFLFQTFISPAGLER